MLNLPLHDLLIHFPLVMGVLIPIIALQIFIGIEFGWLHENSWLILPLLGLIYAILGAVAGGFSDAELAILRQHIDADALQRHAKLAELVPLTAAVVCILAPLPVVLTEKRKVRLIFLAVSGFGVWPVVTVAMSHANLIYRHGVGCLPPHITLPPDDSQNKSAAAASSAAAPSAAALAAGQQDIRALRMSQPSRNPVAQQAVFVPSPQGNCVQPPYTDSLTGATTPSYDH